MSWHTLQPVQNPRVVLGHLDGKLEQTVEAKATSYTDAKSGQIVYAYHAKLGGLQADSAYLYGAMHDGAEPEFGTFRTVAAWPRAVHVHELRRSGHADARQEVRAARGRDAAESAVT